MKILPGMHDIQTVVRLPAQLDVHVEIRLPDTWPTLTIAALRKIEEKWVSKKVESYLLLCMLLQTMMQTLIHLQVYHVHIDKNLIESTAT